MPTSEQACDVHGLKCAYLAAHCPDTPLGPSYDRETYVFTCEAGEWSWPNKDCLDCCNKPNQYSDSGHTGDAGTSP